MGEGTEENRKRGQKKKPRPSDLSGPPGKKRREESKDENRQAKSIPARTGNWDRKTQSKSTSLKCLKRYRRLRVRASPNGDRKAAADRREKRGD